MSFWCRAGACYDEGKRVAETMMYSYQRQVGVEVRVARIFNTFGRRMHPNDGRVVSNFIIQALQNKDITRRRGAATRGFHLNVPPGKRTRVARVSKKISPRDDRSSQKGSDRREELFNKKVGHHVTLFFDAPGSTATGRRRGASSSSTTSSTASISS